MAGRGFCVKIQLDLQAITCPGVWLCPNGKVALQINTLSSTVESHRISPVFPLLFHDKFTLKKVFTRVATLAELQHSLEQEFVYAELIQWPVQSGRGIILATFETNLVDLLYPAPCFKGLLAGVDVDLLMEPTKHFPGIIAPKIEVSTRTTIMEVSGICDVSTTGAYVVNPKTIHSKRVPCGLRKRPVKGIIRQRRVCHSQGKSRVQSCQVYNQKPKNIESSQLCSVCLSDRHPASDRCYHAAKKKPHCINELQSRKIPESSAICNNLHIFDSCPVCLKYKCYFSSECAQKAQEKITRRSENVSKDNIDPKCVQSCTDNGLHCNCKSDDRRNDTAISVLRSKIRQLQRTKEDCDCTASNKTDNFSEYSCENCREQPRQGFYKNLEKFYKRMYKQARMRAQGGDG